MGGWMDRLVKTTRRGVERSGGRRVSMPNARKSQLHTDDPPAGGGGEDSFTFLREPNETLNK